MIERRPESLPAEREATTKDDHEEFAQEENTRETLAADLRDFAHDFTEWKISRTEGGNAPERVNPEEIRIMEKLLYGMSDYLHGNKSVRDVIASIAGESSRLGIEMRDIEDAEDQRRNDPLRVTHRQAEA